MNSQFDMLSIAALCGWLALAVMSFASFRLSWKKGVTIALAWAAIFAALTAIITFTRG
jgi:hypothetical protein